jgi:multidrug efflux pump subunit AcrA (membrane-fusion protein)
VRRLAALLLLAVSAATACHRSAESAEPADEPKAGASPSGVPVRVAVVARADLAQTVSGPGRVVALAQQKVRAPFTGTLTELSVADGDTVRKGQTVGVIVSRETEAALSGAREMLREARTPAERSDAERALALAEKNLVRSELKSPVDGAVLSHAENAGERVSEDQEILAISATDSLVFQADVAQSELARVRPGQAARLTLAGRNAPIAGTVHDVLPSVNTADFTAPVRIDLPRITPPLPMGLFGTAQIVVNERRNVPVVPPQAILRDDVSGVARIATVTADGKARWINVQTGLSDANRVEIVSPKIADGVRVVVSGQVGLPEGSALAIQP